MHVLRIMLNSTILSFQGTLNHIGRIFILLEEAGLKANLGSYCAALECMGRNDNCYPGVISRYVQHTQLSDFFLTIAIKKCKYVI